MQQSRLRDRGAVAVEFALVALPLTILTFGIIYFGYAFFVQTSLDNAARDAVWYYTLSETGAPAAARDAANTALTPLLGENALDGAASLVITPGGTGCAATEIATATITYNEALPLTGFLGWDVQLQGSGSMRCNA